MEMPGGQTHSRPPGGREVSVARPSPASSPLIEERDPVLRVRVTFEKGEVPRWTGHLDLQRLWERLLRRSHLAASYSRGFRPSARIQLACALPLGFTSTCEIADLWLDEDPGLAQVEEALRRASPPGIEILRVEAAALSEPALQTRVRSVEYEAALLDLPPHTDVSTLFQPLVEADSLPREWKKKRYDLRPLIEALRALPPGADGLPRVTMRLAAREGATGRPEEVLAAAGLDPASARVRRTGILFTD
jgi:radical SAM-linked protein